MKAKSGGVGKPNQVACHFGLYRMIGQEREGREHLNSTLARTQRP